MSVQDIIVIGAGAGEVQSVESVLSGIPRDLPGAVLIVQSKMARILIAAGETSNAVKIFGRQRLVREVFEAVQQGKVERIRR